MCTKSALTHLTPKGKPSFYSPVILQGIAAVHLTASFVLTVRAQPDDGRYLK